MKKGDRGGFYNGDKKSPPAPLFLRGEYRVCVDDINMRIKADINSNAVYTRSHSANVAKAKNVPPARWLRLALCLVTIALSGMLLYPVGNRLASQIHYAKAKSALKDDQLWIAVHYLRAAIRCDSNDFMFWRKLGEVYNRIGRQESSVGRAVTFAGQARAAYLESYRRNALDAASAFGLAKSEARLERLYAIRYPDRTDNPYDPIPYLNSAIDLSPNSIQYHYARARYLHRSGRILEMIQAVQSLSRIFPGAYERLKKEPLWSPEVQVAVAKGLREAIDEGIAVNDAHRALSQLLADEQNWPEAIRHFSKALALQKEISARDYIQLGRLYLYSNQPEESMVDFYKAMRISPDKENSFTAITNIFNSKSHQHEFSLFYSEIEKTVILSPGMQISAARKFIDMQLLDHAQRILKTVNDYRPTAEAYYWLARIAEIEKDWDVMEINIQKATVLEPANKHYRSVFTKLRKRLGKDKDGPNKAS